MKLGVESIVATRGGAILYGGPMLAHGYNNIHEGILNIYNEKSDTVGPVREFYRDRLGNDDDGDIAYYLADLMLSGVGLVRKVSKADTYKLFRRLPEDYERAYKQAGKISLALEAFVDWVSVQSIYTLKKEHQAKTQAQDGA